MVNTSSRPGINFLPFQGAFCAYATAPKGVLTKEVFSKSEDIGAGVLLDTCVAIITVETEARFWLFWMAPDASGKVQGHTISGDKEEGEVDVLADFCHDLTTVAHFSRLHQVHSLEEAERVLIDRVKVTPQAAQGIVAYLRKN